ncbi:MAG TPA: DUF1015 domain-containing protein [Ilumatobacteraceae bacterium]|nr:DUF1015 domain-containing protein [Ilumatobacteraceae bacterium]
MPRFTPFPALRYCDRVIDDLIAPPYDVLSDADLAELGARSRFNITHVDVPQEHEGPDRYLRAAATLREWIDAGVMEYDDVATYTIYRMRFTDATGTPRDISGVLGGLEVVDEGAGGVLPHERVTPKASTDRLDLTRATQANLSPVWGLSLATGLTQLLAEPGEPVSAVTVDGVEHIVERVSDPARIAAISALLASDDVLIADGHHRYGISRTYRDEVRSSNGDQPSPADDTLAFVNELVGDQLSVEAIHRQYHDIAFDDLVGALDACFERSDAGAPGPDTLATMDRDEVLCLVSPDGQAQWLAPRPGAFDGVRSLDGAWLEHALADVEHHVTYQHGLDHVVDAVVTGSAVAAVLIRPVSVAEIERTAREGALMPPKSTFFTPKLRTGLVIRSLA